MGDMEIHPEETLIHQVTFLLHLSTSTALLIGIVLTVVGSCLMAVGSVSMKLGIHAESRSRPGTSVGSCPFCQPWWWTGFAAYSFGALLHIAALAFAPASVLAPMNSLGLVANAAVAATILSESFGMIEALGTLGTIVGVTLCAVASFLPHDESGTVTGLDSWRDPWYLAYAGICSVITLAILIYVNNEEVKVIEKRWDADYARHVKQGHIEFTELGGGIRIANSGSTDRPPRSDSIGMIGGNTGMIGHNTGGMVGNTGIVRPDVVRSWTTGVGGRRPAGETVPLDSVHLLAGEENSEGRQSNEFQLEGNWVPTYPAHISMLYGFLGGLIGAQCVLELKEFCACLRVAWIDSSIWCSPLPYVSSLVCVVAIVLQIHFLNFGLGRGDATLVIPTYYVFWTMFGTLGGFAKFHEMSGFGVGQFVLFILGLLVTLLCIGFMAVREMENIEAGVDKAIPVLMGEALETDEARAERLRRLQIRVPLAFGYGIIPAGRLSGRLRTDKALLQKPLRKTRSHQDLFSERMRSDGSSRNAGNSRSSSYHASSHISPAPAAYHWTLAGGNIPPMVRAQVMHAQRNIELQGFTSPAGSNSPNTLPRIASPQMQIAQPLSGATGGGPRLPAMSFVGKSAPSRHRGLHDIVFEEDEEVGSLPQQFQQVEYHKLPFPLSLLWRQGD